MNNKPSFDDAVNRWIDDGPDTAPERFVWAALEDIERTPQRGAWRVALESVPMFVKLFAPLTGATAVIILAIVAYQQLAPTNGPAQAPSQSAVPSPAEMPSPTQEACGVSAPTSERIDVVWCVPRGADRLVVEFMMEAPRFWAETYYAGRETLYLRPRGNPAIAFTLSGPDTVDEWLDELSGTAAFDLTEPATTSVGGVSAYVFDVRLAPGAAQGDAPPLFEDVEVPWVVQEGDAARMWLVEWPDEALAIVTGTPEADFEAWAGTVSDAVGTLEWSP